MKLKSFMFMVMVILTAFMVNGCYTQLSTPKSETKEPEYSDAAQADSVDDEAYTRDDDIRHATNVYIPDYDGYYAYGYNSPWADRWNPWWYGYPRTAVYVGVGYSFYDPWYDPYWSPGWCGAAAQPWWWGPNYWYSPWTQPGYAHYPVYEPYPRGGGGASTPEKRPFGRRSAEGDRHADAGGSGAIAKRGSLSRPGETIYVRGEDGSYRRERRGSTVVPATSGNGTATDRTSDRRRATRELPAPESGTVTTTPSYGGGAAAVPARTPQVQQEPARRSSGSSEKGASERRSRSKEKASRPAHEGGDARRDSSHDNSSRRSSAGNSGASHSVSRGSYSGGSSSARSSAPASHGGSSRRSKN